MRHFRPEIERRIDDYTAQGAIDDAGVLDPVVEAAE